MAKKLFETIGNNYQVPGLPYEETFKYVRPVLLDDVPTKAEIAQLLDESDDSTLTNPWSLQVVKGFRDYIPTTFKRITGEMPKDQLEEYFGIDKNWIPEEDRVLLQLQTEVEAKAATIDAAIIHNRMELGTVVNKAHVANRLYMIGRLYNHLQEREYPFLFGDLSSRNDWYRALSEMKMQFMDYMYEVPVGPRTYPIKIRKQDVSQAELVKDYPYIEWLKNKLGDNLIGVLLYGSAARTKNNAEYSDFDNWVRVRDVGLAHKVLQGTKPSVINGKVVEGYDGHSLEAKHLGIHLFPEDDEYTIRHIRFLHDSIEFRKHTKVLMGEFPFPKVALDEVVERGISQAYIKLKTIAGSLNWAYNSPHKIQGKPNLFEFIVKNIRFFLQHSLNAIHMPKFRDKIELNNLLKKRDMALPEYTDDLDGIRDSLLFSMESVLKLQKELLLSGRKPQLEFLVDENIRELQNINPDWRLFDDLGVQ